MTITSSDRSTHAGVPGALLVTNEADDIAALHLSGEFDTGNAHEITEHALQALATDKHLILDLSDTTFIDSSVIHALFKIQAAANDCGRIAVLLPGTAHIVERVITLTGIENVLPRTATREEAIVEIRALTTF